ncbi:MAG TPA: glycosyltransferase family 1 protein [Solirubrobacteraceae bacterium]|nr:glycosyltransferase family 1 protein [Solirubrobacteraceae bacterium]
MERADLTFVTTIGQGSMDKYSVELGRRLPVARLVTDVYESRADVWGLPLLGPRSLRIAARDAAFVAELRRLGQPVHLPNQHLARYGRFLSRPWLITVHDTIRWFDLRGRHEPLIHPPNRRDRLLLGLDYAGIRRATAVIAASHATRRDLVEHVGLEPGRVHVVHEAIDHDLYRPVSRRVVEGPYVLYVGTEHPRKNFGRVLEAFARLRRPGLRLVKAGGPGKGEWDFRTATDRKLAGLGLGEEVVFTGRIPDEDLVALYSGALCLIFPSLYEGFGFPVLEAMACGCPVVTSTASSLPEVAGDAALLVDPCESAAIAAAAARLVDDDALRRDVAERGRRHAAGFTWERCARETLRVYDRVLVG